MLRRVSSARGLAAALVVSLVGLVGCGGGELGPLNFTLPDTSCTAQDTWVVRGFHYGNFTDTASDELLKATMAVGEVAPLRVGTFWNHDCDDALQRVDWISSESEVADLTSTGPLEADLRARRLGETQVAAELTLGDGTRVRAELHAVPSEGSPLLRVYAVRVVR